MRPDLRDAELARLAPRLARPDPAQALETRRRQSDEAGLRARLPAGFARRPDRLGGVAGAWLSDGRAPNDRALLYLHGGGYVSGSSASHGALAAWLAAGAGAPAFLPDYRRAPEAPFPAALEDALSAYRALSQLGPVVLAGDSAGGGLALALALAAAQTGLSQPQGLFLMSPWADLTLRSAADPTAGGETDPVLTLDDLRACARRYLGAADPATPLASPAHADLGGLPPLLIHVGSDEILLGDALAVASRAARAGAAVRLVVWPRMFHVFQAYGGALTDARRALQEAGAWIGDQFTVLARP